jgi:L-threonylcarbamoyladenylate synthase
MLFLHNNRDGISTASAIIVRGGICAFPTETVYGLGADALNPEAVAKIFEAKNRPFFDPLICHVSDIESFLRITAAPDKILVDLAEKFWPGPLTIVSTKRECIPALVTSGLPTVGVRIPRHSVALALLQECKRPVAAPSANPFGYLSPTNAAHVAEMLAGKIDALLDGGACDVGVESTIVQFVEGSLYILRPGGVPAEEIEKAAGREVKYKTEISLPEAPGQCDSHYAPESVLKIINEGEEIPDDDCALLAFRSNSRKNSFRAVEILSHSGDLREAAANLFAALHRLDSLRPKTIYAEKIPEIGLGNAIMNRLRKAAAPKNPAVK